MSFKAIIGTKTVKKVDLTLETLREYILVKVGESSTLFYDNDENIFNSKRAIEIAETMTEDITRLINKTKGEIV